MKTFLKIIVSLANDSAQSLDTDGGRGYDNPHREPGSISGSPQMGNIG